MLSWALTFFILALVAAFFGFGGIAIASYAVIAKLLFFLFLILFVIALLSGESLPMPTRNDGRPRR